MNVNKVFIAGNLTRDPALSYLPNGNTAVVEFGVAVNRKWRDKSGEQKEEVCFVDCRSYAKTAETINQYLTKGKPIFVEGRLKFDSWEAKDGSKRSKLYVIVDNFQFVGGRADGQGRGPAPAPSGEENQEREGPPADYVAPAYSPTTADEIPF